MPDLIRHPHPTWIPAFAEMTNIGIINCRSNNLIQEGELVVSSHAYDESDSLTLREILAGVSEAVIIEDGFVKSLFHCHPGERRGPEGPERTGFRPPPE
jgi:hypothetical protein